MSADFKTRRTALQPSGAATFGSLRHEPCHRRIAGKSKNDREVSRQGLQSPCELWPTCPAKMAQ